MPQDKMPLRQNVTGQNVTYTKRHIGHNVTGRNATQTKCHRTKSHSDKMPLTQNVTGQNATQTCCHRTKCHPDKLSQAKGLLDKMSQEKIKLIRQTNISLISSSQFVRRIDAQIGKIESTKSKLRQCKP